MGAVEFMPVVARTKISRYCRTTVPREVRRLLDLRESDKIKWVFENGVVYIRKAQE